MDRIDKDLENVLEEEKKEIEAEERQSHANDIVERKLEKPEIPKVTGFDKSGVLTSDDVKKDIGENIPKEHLESIPEIQYHHDYVVKQIDKDTKEVLMGDCDPRTGKINIYKQTPEGNIDAGMMRWAYTHEIGHNVYNHLPGKLHSEWNTIRFQDPQDCVTDHAQHGSSNEDFAESYADYIRNPNHLKSTNIFKYDFMRDKTFDGRIYNKGGAEKIKEEQLAEQIKKELEELREQRRYS